MVHGNTDDKEKLVFETISLSNLFTENLCLGQPRKDVLNKRFWEWRWKLYYRIFYCYQHLSTLNTMKNIFRLLSKTSCNTLQIISPVFLRRWLFVSLGHCIVCHSPISDADFPLWYLQTFLRSTDLLQQVQDNSTFFSFAHFTIFLFFTNSWLLSTSLWLNLWAFYFLPNTELF